jgi:hypothetical protein
MPALRRNLTGGSSAIRHPLGPISTQRQNSSQIEVDQAVLLGEADRDFVLRTIELGLRLKHIEGRVSAPQGSAHPRCARSIAGATRPESACFEAARFPGGRRCSAKPVPSLA